MEGGRSKNFYSVLKLRSWSQGTFVCLSICLFVCSSVRPHPLPGPLMQLETLEKLIFQLFFLNFFLDFSLLNELIEWANFFFVVDLWSVATLCKKIVVVNSILAFFLKS